mgnify:CR=1 FL=1
MRKIIISSYCFVLLCVLVSVVAIPIINHKSNASNNNAETPSNSLSYIIKDFNGNIAVFEDNSDTPFKVTEVCTNTLPKLDQERLKEGIVVNSQVELNTLLEDLCS